MKQGSDNVMSEVLYPKDSVRTLFGIQLAILFLETVLFYVSKGPGWAGSALAGGLAAWLPGVFFMILARRQQSKMHGNGRIAWMFALGEVVRVLMMALLLIMAMKGFNAVFVPLGLTWLSVLLVQIVAPTVIDKKG